MRLTIISVILALIAGSILVGIYELGVHDGKKEQKIKDCAVLCTALEILIPGIDKYGCLLSCDRGDFDSIGKGKPGDKDGATEL